MVNIQTSIAAQLIAQDVGKDELNNAGSSPFTLLQQSQEQLNMYTEVSIQAEPEPTWLPAKAFVMTSELGQKLSSRSISNQALRVNDPSTATRELSVAKGSKASAQGNNIATKIIDDGQPASSMSLGFTHFLHSNVEAIAEHGLRIKNSDESLYRILPFGALANGYLSVFNVSNKSFVAPQKISTLNQNDGFDQHVRGLGAKQLKVMAPVFADNTIAQHPAAVFINSRVSNSFSENAHYARSVQVNMTMTSEFARAYLMLTESEVGSTVWYRDYQLNEQDKTSLKKRVISGEWLQQSSVSRLFINGELIWYQDKEYKHD